MSYYFINALIGAAVAVFIAAVSRSQLYVLAGLIPLFPTFALFAHINANHIGGPSQLKEVLIFGFISMVSYLMYLACMYFATQQGLKFIHAASISIAVWLISAVAVIYLAKKYILQS